MQNFVLLTLTVSAVLAFVKQSGAKAYEGNQVWRIVPQNDEHLRLLTELSTAKSFELDPWKPPTNIKQPVDFHVSAKEFVRFKRYLNSKQLSYEILIKDVQHLVNNQVYKQLNQTAKLTKILNFNYSVYHRAEEIDQWMNVVENEYDYITKIQVGVTYEGRSIYALQISKSDPSKPAIYVDAMIHAREWVTTGALLFVLKEMLTNNEYSWMTSNLNWYVIPMINVDGYIYSWTSSGRLWRKTKSAQATLNRVGVDANRNFDEHWGGPGSSEEPDSSTYHGPFAESESETRHTARFISAHSQSIKAVVSLHSYSQLILYPYNFAKAQYPNNTDEQNKTAEAMSAAMFAVHNISYDWGAGAEALSVSTGVTTDWTQAKTMIDINYTIELRDTGEYAFLLPENQIIPTGEELLAGLTVLAKHVINKYNASSETL